MKHVAILGSTGSIGTNTLEVISRFADRFDVFGLTANSNIELLISQSRRFNPKKIAFLDSVKAKEFQQKINSSRIKVLSGIEGFVDIVTDDKVDIVILATAGNSMIVPLLSAIKARKSIGLANKEVLISAGQIIMAQAKAMGIPIVPIDSEHNAVFQCLQSEDIKFLNKIYLTSSGGPLLNIASSKFDSLGREFILKHPRWRMGKKITVDSATLMNKGFEVIEAMYLFDVDSKKIDVVIHPQAIVHSMVEFIDGSILAQLSATDMKIPIQYALSYPQRLTTPFGRLKFSNLNLEFKQPDLKKFPCLKIACDVAKEGGSLCAVLSAADEELVKAYLEYKIKFSQIPIMLEKILSWHKKLNKFSLGDILKIDKDTRILTNEIIGNI